MESQAIADWIKAKFGVSYTVEGLVPLLHHLGFCYKKTKQIPCEANLEKQAKFVASFADLLADLPDNEAIFSLMPSTLNTTPEVLMVG